MDIKKDMKNIKDDVVKGASKLGNAVKHTAKKIKKDVKGMSMEVGEIAGDMKEKYEDSKLAKEIKKQMKK